MSGRLWDVREAQKRKAPYKNNHRVATSNAPSQLQLAREVLALCEHCGRTGPKDLLSRHVRDDHGVMDAT